MTAPQVHVINGEPFGWVHDCARLDSAGDRHMMENRHLALDGRWTVAGSDDDCTLTPAIVCTACGLHGQWLEGRWRGRE